MTNYYNYPEHRFFNNTCIICFDEHKYSWTDLTPKQRKYLMNSTYTHGAKYIDIKTDGGKVYRLSSYEFGTWLGKGILPEQNQYDQTDECDADGNIIKKKCPVCGGTLIIKTAKRGWRPGNKFWGCSNYPRCSYLENVEPAE